MIKNMMCIMNKTMSRYGKILALMVMAIMTCSYAVAADKDLTLPVWVFSPTDTDPANPTNTFETLSMAMAYTASTLKKNNAVIELHGDTYETSTSIRPLYSVTVRSEAGANHTVSYKNYSSATPTYGLISAQAGITMTLGGGDGYGTLTFDFCGKLGGLTMSNGTVNIQDGVIFKNGKAEKGGAVRLNSTSGTPLLYVSGGSFINNEATDLGGAIHVAIGKLFLSGGTFTGNTAANKGNAIYNGNNREVHVSGNPVFNNGQDIYIDSNKTADATDITALIKDGTITSSNIPVTIGSKEENLFGYRNVLVGGKDIVVESDLEHFTIFNKEELSAMYLGLGYNANDATKKAPVLELVTDFLSNFNNFIDNNYKPAPSGFSHAKSAIWLDEDKNQAEITIDESSSDGKTVLIIGSLCGAHGLTSDCIKTVINEAAKHNNVEYYFESITAGAKSQWDQGIAGVVRGPVKGSLSKGATLPKAKTFETYSGAHQATGAMAKELAKRLQEKQYFEIIFIFDNATITDQCFKALTPEEQKACYMAANMLVPYYDSEKIIWVSSGQKVMYMDYEKHTGYTYDKGEINSLLMKGCYSTDTSLYHYDTSHVTSTQSTFGRYDKFNTYFTMALMDPATWLKGVKEKRIPEWSEYTINTEGVLYYNVDDIVNFIGNKFFRDEIVISDVVASGLNIKEVHLESSSDGGKTWSKMTDHVSIKIEGQSITCDVTDMTEDTDIRLKIACDCPGEFLVDKNKPKDTNVGKATIVYKKSGETKLSYNLESPQLLKVFPKTDVIIRKKGLKNGESAMFTVSKTGDSMPLFNVLLTGNGKEYAEVAIINIIIGEYTVAETSWSWAYNKTPLNPITKVLTKEKDSNIYLFENVEKDVTPLHSEAIKDNNLNDYQ